MYSYINMKKLYILFILLIILSTNANAFCLFGLGNCNKVVGVNPIFNDEETILLKEMNLKEVLEYKTEDIEREMPLSIIKISLPLILNVELENNETFCIIINKIGKISILGPCNYPDIIIKSDEEKLKNLFLTETNQELIDKITQITIEPVTFRGKLITQIIENYFDIKIVKNKSTSQKLIAIVTVPIVGIINVFN